MLQNKPKEPEGTSGDTEDESGQYFSDTEKIMFPFLPSFALSSASNEKKTCKAFEMNLLILSWLLVVREFLSIDHC